MYTTDVAVIGAGQAGLAMGRCLSNRGIDHVVFERGEVGARWQSHAWDSLRLLTPNWLNGLPGSPYHGDDPDGLSWATEVLARKADAAPGEGRALFSGLLSLGFPDDPVGACWRAADLVREHRGDSHIAAWIDADLDACEIGILTDPWRGQPLKSWVRSRGWTEDELDGAIERLSSRGLLDGEGPALLVALAREQRGDQVGVVGGGHLGGAAVAGQLRDEPADVRIVVDDEHAAFAHTCFIPARDRLPYAR